MIYKIISLLQQGYLFTYTYIFYNVKLLFSMLILTGMEMCYLCSPDVQTQLDVIPRRAFGRASFCGLHNTLLQEHIQ